MSARKELEKTMRQINGAMADHCRDSLGRVNSNQLPVYAQLLTARAIAAAGLATLEAKEAALAKARGEA